MLAENGRSTSVMTSASRVKRIVKGQTKTTHPTHLCDLHTDANNATGVCLNLVARLALTQWSSVRVATK